MPYLRLLLLVLCLPFAVQAEENEKIFTVMVYNVENVFDVDGIAMYDDYKQVDSKNKSPYSPAKLLTKIQNLSKNVAAAGDKNGGPQVIMFQEFERDRTPNETFFDYDDFLVTYTGTTVESMLTTDFNETIADIPAEAFALKYFVDNGIGYYNVSVAESTLEDNDAKAHNNIVFSKFPILDSFSVPTVNARPIQVITVDVLGSPFTLINNHWKSGASSARREGDRIHNAKDTRAALEKILENNPYADVIIAGDLNTYYNAAEYFPTQGWTIDEYAIQALGSQGDELAIRDVDGPDLYNLWFEVPAEGRGSEFYQGSWGTLMQMLITRGLYDTNGVQYVDGSFQRIEIPGVTTHGTWGTPRSWHFAGESGGGFSDHLPVIAKFKYVGDGEPGAYIELENPGTVTEAVYTIPTIDMKAAAQVRYPKSDTLVNLDDASLAHHYGELYEVWAPISDTRPFTIKLGERDMEVYTYSSEARSTLREKEVGEKVAFIGELSEYKGTPQFVVHDETWIKTVPAKSLTND